MSYYMSVINVLSKEKFGTVWHTSPRVIIRFAWVASTVSGFIQGTTQKIQNGTLDERARGHREKMCSRSRPVLIAEIPRSGISAYLSR